MNVIVAGGGVSGCISAIGLKKLGYDVVLFDRPRPFEAYEGFSQRTIDALKHIGTLHALRSIGPWSPRASTWNGISRDANHEYLTYRPDFDRALIQDAVEHGVEVYEGSVIGVISHEEHTVRMMVKMNDEVVTWEGDAAIDARGRFTPYPHDYETGPKSFSLLQKISLTQDLAPRTTLHSVEEGWIWQASLGNGIGYIQMTCDHHIAQSIHNSDDFIEYIKKYETWILEGEFTAEILTRRDSYGKLHHDIVSGRVFRVGDAASSIDPLSGNGVFQSLSMATILPYVIHSVLVSDELDNGVASQFYKERVKELFYRYSTKGRDFYCSEEQFSGEYWRERREWPQTLFDKSAVHISNKAILKAPFIESQEVVVTSEHPMGVRYFEGIDILPIVRTLLQSSEEERIEQFERLLSDKNERFYYQFRQWAILNSLI